MASHDISARARQGDPKAIAALLNHSTKSRGITAQVARKEYCLHILLESDQALDQQAVVTLICRGIEKLKVEGTKTVKVYGRQSGQNSIAWNQEIQLESFSCSRPPPTERMPQMIEPSPIYQVIQPPEFPPDIPPNLYLSASSTDEVEQEKPVEFSAETDVSQLAGTQELFQRPEALVLIIFASLILFWQLYLDLVGEADSDVSLSGGELAERLGINRSTVSRRKNREDFGEWTRNLDPDGIAWAYESGRFLPRLLTP